MAERKDVIEDVHSALGDLIGELIIPNLPVQESADCDDFPHIITLQLYKYADGLEHFGRPLVGLDSLLQLVLVHGQLFVAECRLQIQGAHKDV